MGNKNRFLLITALTALTAGAIAVSGAATAGQSPDAVANSAKSSTVSTTTDHRFDADSFKAGQSQSQHTSPAATAEQLRRSHAHTPETHRFDGKSFGAQSTAPAGSQDQVTKHDSSLAHPADQQGRQHAVHTPSKRFDGQSFSAHRLTES